MFARWRHLDKDVVAVVVIEDSSLSIRTIGGMYGVDGSLLSRQYKEHISDFREWKQRYHAGEYVLFKQNLGPRLSIDETCLSQGELYTLVTNKSAHGRKGSLVAMIRGTKVVRLCHTSLRTATRGGNC